MSRYFQLAAGPEVVKLLPVIMVKPLPVIIFAALFCTFCKRSFSLELQHSQIEQQWRKYGSTVLLYKLFKQLLEMKFLVYFRNPIALATFDET